MNSGPQNLKSFDVHESYVSFLTSEAPGAPSMTEAAQYNHFEHCQHKTFMHHGTFCFLFLSRFFTHKVIVNVEWIP